MKFLKIIRPDIQLDSVAACLETQYGLVGTLSELYSERDLNCRLIEPGGAAWVVKIASVEEDPAVIECQLEAMRHIERVDPTLPVPRVRRTTDGRDLIQIDDSAGTAHFLYVLSFLAGDLAEDHACDPGFATSIGRMVARLGIATRGFFHAAAGGRELLWDIRMAARLLPYVDRLSRPSSRDMAREIITGLIERVLPRLESLRAQIIHGDIHRQNLIVDPLVPTRITGMIDFGDIIHAPIAMDLGNLGGEFLLTPEMALTNLLALTDGYHQVTPLAPEEIELIYDLAIGRALLAPLINRYRQTETPDSIDYIQASGETGLEIDRSRAGGRTSSRNEPVARRLPWSQSTGTDWWCCVGHGDAQPARTPARRQLSFLRPAFAHRAG